MSNNGRSLKKYIFLLAILCLMVSYILFLAFDSDLSDKNEWSILQGVELKYRKNSSVDFPILLDTESHGLVLLGVPSASMNSPYAWLILNAVTVDGGLFFLSNDNSFLISCDYIDSIKQKVTINSPVLSFLYQSCL